MIRHPTQPARLALVACLAAGALMWGTRTASAEPCSRDSFAKVVNELGAALRRLSAETQPKMQAGFRRLKDKNGWREDDYIDKATALVTDERSEALDQKATDCWRGSTGSPRTRPILPTAAPSLPSSRRRRSSCRPLFGPRPTTSMARLEAPLAHDRSSGSKGPAQAAPRHAAGRQKGAARTAVASRPPDRQTEKEKRSRKAEPARQRLDARAHSQQNPQSAENALPVQPLPGKEYTPLPHG